MRRRRSLLALAALLTGFAATAGAAEPLPRIVNGSVSFAHPTTGALLEQDSNDPTRLDGLCSGTLIGCRTFLTAAHCVCPENTDDATGCLAEGTTDPSTLRVFLPNAGIVAVQSVEIDPQYSFAVSGDVGIVHLAAPVTGLRSSPLNEHGRLDDGTLATIVGYGSTGGPPFRASDYGIKRDGKVTTGPCASDVSADAHVCWSFSGVDASTCSGDSGGPLFVDFGDGPVVAGITSGGESFACSPPDQVFDTDVYVYRDWIRSRLGDDETGACGDLPPAGEDGTIVAGLSGDLSATTPQGRFDFTVPPGTRKLRVALNAVEVTGGFNGGANDFDLFVQSMAQPAQSFACEDTTPGVYGFCEIDAPIAGDWHALATRVDGTGRAQITVTIFGAGAAGDVNCDGRVDAADALALAQGIAADGVPACPDADADGDGILTAGDLDPLLANVFAE